MKNILVTGGAGYIGSHTIKELIKQGFEVTVYDNLSSGSRKAVLGPAELIVGDLLDVGKLNSVFKKNKIDAVIHFAASIEAGESEKMPELFFENNVVCSLNLLNAMIKANVWYLIFSSSAAVYGEPKEVPIKEDHELKPINCYGSTKMMAEEMLKYFDNSHELKYISLRYFNAAGADFETQIGEDHDPETHLIPNILNNALGGKTCYVFGNDYDTHDGTCIRDYIHVDDLARAHILALKYLKNKKTSGVFNLGSERGNSILEVIDKSKKVTGIDFKVEFSNRRQGDPAVLVASNKKAKKNLGWEPEHDLGAIIETAFRWHKKKHKK